MWRSRGMKTKRTISATPAVGDAWSAYCETQGFLIGNAASRVLAWYLAQPDDKQQQIHAEGGELMRAGRSDLASNSDASRKSLAEVAEGKPARIRKVRSS